jgi:60 kDa SS-A/Ro ribonucleoprotein
MTDSLRGVRTRAASLANPHRVAPVGTKVREDQIKNSDGGGYVFKVDAFDQAKRFLILGSEANFYRSGAEMSAENAKVVIGLASDARTSKQLVDLIVEVSTAGRAPKQNPAIFALAVAASHGDDESKAYALSKLPAVARTGTTLFLFAEYVEQFRGWGRGLKRAVANWYTSKPTDKAAFQAVKYQSRNGWSHKDLMSLTHPGRAGDEAFRGLVNWIRLGDTTNVPTIVEGFLKAQKDGADVPALIREYGLSWEMLPTQALNDADVWKALFEANLPLGALLRQLPRLTRLGLLAPLGDLVGPVVKRLTDEDELQRARIHPIALLIAQKTYAKGEGRAGRDYTPNQKIVDALNAAFYLAFKTVVPTGKNTLIGVDVSGSMGGSYGVYDYKTGRYSDGPPLTPAEVAAAMALVTLNVEENSAVFGFATTLVELPISPKMRLDQVLEETSKRNFGSTNPGALIERAIKDNLKVETFIVITDNDVNGGRHVFQLLEKYRKQTGIPARMVVLAVTASDYSIADPNDPLSLDLAGFDSATPSLIADFSRGDV